MLYDASERDSSLRVVDHRVPLIIGHIKYLLLESHCPVFKFAESIAKIFIDFSGEHNLIGHFLQNISGFEEIHPEPYFDTFQQAFYQSVIPTDRYALVTVVEIIVVECQPHRQTTDDERRKLRAPAPPLLFGITLYQSLIYISTDKQQRLLFKITRLGDTGYRQPFPCFSSSVLSASSGVLTPHICQNVFILNGKLKSRPL